MRALRIFDDGDGTVSVTRELSFNSALPLAAGELARFDLDGEQAPAPPAGVPARYWAWDGEAIVEAGQAVKDAVDAAAAAEEAAWENARAPDTGWENFSRRDRFMLRVVYKLAREIWPSMTLDGFLTAVRTEWDETKGEA